jgi:very-short-patch-repair endonuclease
MVDFYCHAARLVVELDGGQHEPRKDAVRTARIESSGLLILRFWNDQVLRETDAVLEVIFRAWQERTLSPVPLPLGEGIQKAKIHD